jgi:deoxycytidine triphosphate deaminase
MKIQSLEKPLDCKKLNCVEDDDNPRKTQGVLLSHDIKYYALSHGLISPFKEENLKPSGIRLSLGREYAIGGELKELIDEPGKNLLTIPPFQVAIISTAESINLPRFLIARWNLRVSLVYKGLLWTGALQVDAGWCGPLYCPIYNLSNEPVDIKLDEPIVLMDFVKTSDFLKSESIEYKRPPSRKTLKDYNYRLKSALFTEAAGRVDKLEKDYEKRISRVESSIALMIASMAILYAALSIIVTSRDVDSAQISTIHPWLIVWPAMSIGISLFALYISVSNEFPKKWIWVSIVFFCLLLILFILLAPPTITGIFSHIIAMNFFPNV